MINLASGVVKNLQVEVLVGEIKTVVSVNGTTADCKVDIMPSADANNGQPAGMMTQGGMSVSMNVETEATLTSMYNITDIEAANTLVNGLIEKVKEVVTELKTIGA